MKMLDAAAPLERLGDDIRAHAWDLAVEVVEEGVRTRDMRSLRRLGRLEQLGDVPTFIAELGKHVADPKPTRIGSRSPLARLARDHGRQREAFGWEPREIVLEFLLLRRVLWRFVSKRTAALEAADVIEAERRLNDAIDRLIAECVVTYFETATAELSERARRDALTGLLNQREFAQALERECDRGRRYGHGISLVFFDLDRFKTINDTYGHQEGDRVLQVVAAIVRDVVRGSDLAGRMGGDEFAIALVESDPEAASRLIGRLSDRIDELVAAEELPPQTAVSPGVAHFPSDGDDVESLFRHADQGLYASKRARRDDGVD